MSLNKTNVAGFVKDTKTGMVTNTDSLRLEEYKMARNKSKEFKAMKDDIENMKTRIATIEGSLKVLLNIANNIDKMLLNEENHGSE